MVSDFPDGVLKVTDENFKEEMDKYPMFILDCWAEWCPPCKMLAPMIEKLVQEHKGKIVFGKLNIDENSMIPGKYEVMSIPTLLVFKEGKLVDKIIGAMPYDVLNSKVKGYL
ncbi:MAG: thioredoxin [Candidatus Aenigmatarchaeota archaeon]